MKFATVFPVVPVLLLALGADAHAWGDHPEDLVPPTEGAPPPPDEYSEEAEREQERSTLPKWSVTGVSLTTMVISDKTSEDDKAATAIVGGPGARLEAVAPGALPHTEVRGGLDTRLLLLGRGEARGNGYSFSGGSISLDGEASWLPVITGNRHGGLRLRLGAAGAAHLGGVTALLTDEERDAGEDVPVLDPRADGRAYGVFGLAYHDDETLGEIAWIHGVNGELAGPELLVMKGLRGRILVSDDLLASVEAIDHRFWLGPQGTEHRLRELSGSVYRRASPTTWLGADARISDRDRDSGGVSGAFSRTSISVTAGVVMGF